MSNKFLSLGCIKAGLAAVCLLAAGASYGQQAVNLSAGAATATLPDGTAVPMWGYTCGTLVSGSTATCARLNAAATAAGAWSPVVITVPTGQDLQINLTNNLSFSPSGNSVPTSLVIVGQLGGGLGDAATTTPSPDHSNAQPVTWPIANSGPLQAPVGVGTPPMQPPRVQSFATEVAAGNTAMLTWTAPRPGTYLIESGTHPSIQGPMGLYGILVVTAAPAAAGGAESAAGTAYPGVSYDAEVPLLLSEIDPVQNAAVSAAVNTSGFSETAVWSGHPGGCGTAAVHNCYPPAVNYTPLYYLFNGVAFDKTHAAGSLFGMQPAKLAPAVPPGNVLVRLVNAGLRMHVPSIVGAQTGTPSVPGFTLVAEDGNLVPGAPRVQNEVFMAAGKTYDVMIHPSSGTTATPVFDRELSLSGNATSRDAGLLAYIGTVSAAAGGGALPAAPALSAAVANADTYNSVIAGQTLVVSDPGKGVIANDVNVYGVKILTPPAQGTLVLNADGTFTYTANAGFAGSDSFVYQANGTGPTASVTLGAAPLEAAAGITMGNLSYTSKVATQLNIKPPGILVADNDASGYALTVNAASVTPVAGLTLSVDPSGGFNASVAAPGTYTFTYKAQNAQGTVSSSSATVTLVFPKATGLSVTVLDGKDKVTTIADYRWIIEEDRTFYVNPNCTTNPPPAGCPGSVGGTVVPTFGTNFHTSYMPVVATGCTGALSCESGQSLLGTAAVCDGGNGVCRTTGTQQAPVLPSQVALDPTKRYYISVLPGDAANPFDNTNLGATCANGVAGLSPAVAATCGHGMGGAPVPLPTLNTTTGTYTYGAVRILTQPTPFPPAKLSVIVFEDDFPLNGEQDAGGGIDVLATNERGLGSFNITLFDDAGGTGDATGQMTYDMFNQPLSNSLAGTPDPLTGNDACPISKNSRQGVGDVTQTGITGTIVTCPTFESDGVTLSPLAGQAVVANMMPGRYGVVATPAADRIARGEEWLQTNTLDGQKAHDSFLRIGEPSYFQEFGPAGYHVAIGFANPAIINGRHAGVCNGTDLNVTGTNCTNSIHGTVTTERMSRTPDERLYSSGSNDSFAFTQCFVSFGDTDGEDFAFTKCNADGTFSLTGLPDGTWRVTVFDQWNDMLVDGLSTPVALGGGKLVEMGDIAMNQWQANIYTRTFLDLNGNGVADSNEPGLTLVPTNIRFRDGSFSNFNNTDLSGNAGFNEVFPLFSWYVIETDSTRFKNTGTHVVYDAGGPSDGSAYCGPSAPCGASSIANLMANTAEVVSVPANLRVPGAVYCAGADCTGHSIAAGAGSSDPPSACTTASTGATSCTTSLSTGRIDPPWVVSEAWQGFSGQNSFIEFGKTPFATGENGGIRGHVIYASTRPFDDPQLLLQTSWEPLVPGVTINLYQEGTAPDGSVSLKLVDSTKTSSWDDWAQGFRSDGMPNMNCPGQGRDTGTTPDLFFFTLFNQPMWLDVYANGGTATHTVPGNSQFKCYDGMHNWNQVQPAPYDGMYQFPSIAGRNPTTGAPTGGTGSVTGTNCTACVANPADGTPMLPAGRYVVEVVVPPGYELVKEEDKNILIGDNYIAPVTVEFPGLGSAIYILPDQASLSELYGANVAGQSGYNANNAQNPTQALGRISSLPSHEGDTGSVESFWPCVGATRIVPDYISLFPGSKEVSPFAGATRHLCDRKEVQLDDQSSVLAKFYIFTSTHAAAHFTGVITDDFTSEFDPFSPQFGEKFSPPNMPIAFKDWAGNEISRVYSDQWGTYNGLTYSTWEVNPPNPTGYAPTMMVTCMNDPGTGATPDPLFNPAYSQFCYEIPFMPGQTQYMDTPVVPTSAFAGAGYNNPDCSYPDATPAIASVSTDAGLGPWAPSTGSHTVTIKALGDQQVFNNGYSGPSAATAPFNAKTVNRHYGFGAAKGTVKIGPSFTVPATSVTWSDTTITLTLSAAQIGNVPACTMQQQAQYIPATVPTTERTARCGELSITTSALKQSVDTVTMTFGGKPPTHVNPTTGAVHTIQTAIDQAMPGDLIIVDPGVYQELVLMWKPVRLQGVGAASSVINANTQPAGKLDPWRAQVNCLFGLALNGQPLNEGPTITFPDGSPSIVHNPYDVTGARTCPASNWVGFQGSPNNPQVDRIPLEGIVGWDTTLNGNLAQLLQEPTLMGAYEGAGITILAKGVRYPGPGVVNPVTHAPYPPTNVFGTGQDTAANASIAHEGQFPVPSIELQGPTFANGFDCTTQSTNPANNTGYTSNFQCNPSRIDGLSVTDSSQGGGGIFAHGWAHNLEISNDRVYNNTGTLTGGIVIGQGESPDALLAGNEGDPIGYNGGTLGGFDQQPWTCLPGATAQGNVENVNPPNTVNNQQLPYCYNTRVNIHHNAITRNSSIGDELFSGTPAGAGGVTLTAGADYYKFTNNWVCGNLSTGDGGGVSHLGFIYNGTIQNNTILFNQSTNPTIPANGGGIVVMGAAPDGAPAGAAAGTECGSVTDVDCAPGLSDGTGPGLLIDANLVLGNSADSGSGGGIRLQSVNGTDVGFFPLLGTPLSGFSPGWNSVLMTNNIIANNVAGWDGAGVSLQDALVVNMVHNTIISNDSTASSGVLFNTLGAPLASAPGDPNQSTSTTTSAPQPAGVASMRNSSLLTGSLTGLPVICPLGHGTSGTTCRNFSVPLIYNSVIWQNRSFYIGVGALGAGTLNQQNVVALYNAFTTTRAPSEPTADATTGNGAGTVITGGTGACVTGVSYWDIGVRGDTGPSNHSSGLTLSPNYSIITDAGDYPGANNSGGNPTMTQQYCNGSRTPPEFLSLGYQVPPGISDATVPNPVFNLTPAATVDEGNNWINMSWGPLALTNSSNGSMAGQTLGNYAPATGSPAINYISLLAGAAEKLLGVPVPSTDFFGNPRPSGLGYDAGAVEFQGTSTPVPFVSPTVLSFGKVALGATATQTITLSNTGGTSLTGITVTVTGAGFSRNGGTCTGTLTVLTGTCTIIVQYAPTAAGSVTGSVAVTGSKTVVGSPVTLSATAVAAPTLTSIAPASGFRGNTVAVTLTGTNFDTSSTPTLTVSGTGVTVSNVTVVSATSITATFAIGTGSTTTAGARTVTLGMDGATVTGTFTVQNPPTAMLTSLSPAAHARGSSFTVTFSGNNFTTAGTSVAVTRTGGAATGITVSTIVVTSPTSMTATFNVAGNAANGTNGARSVTVSNANGTASNALTFTVQ